MSEQASNYRIAGDPAPDLSQNQLLTLARRQIIDGSLDQVDACRQALLSARMFNEAGDAEMTSKALRLARKSADELHRQLIGVNPE